VIQQEIRSATASWRSGQTIDVKAMTDALAIRTAARVFFSADLSDEMMAEIQRLVAIITKGTYQRTITPIAALHKIPTPANRAFDQAVARMRRIIEEVIRAHRASNTNQQDLLSMLVSTPSAPSSGQLADQEIHDQVMTLLVAGSDTSSKILAWTLHLLGQHPDVDDRLRAELEQELGGRIPDFADLPRLTYAHRVIAEVLRLYPPVWLLTRTTTADTELGDHPIAARSMILFSPYQLHRDPALFPEPHRFDPDRWLPEHAKVMPRGAVIPFGGGSRKCIGDIFGVTEVTIALAAIVSRWHLRPLPGDEVRPLPQVTLAPTQLRMAPHSRP